MPDFDICWSDQVETPPMYKTTSEIVRETIESQRAETKKKRKKRGKERTEI